MNAISVLSHLLRQSRSRAVPVLQDHPSSIVFLVNDVARKEIISNE